MAVYKRNYERYHGALTPPRWRFLILPRYSYQSLFHSRFFTAFFVVCFIVPVAAAVIIYLHHNVSAIRALRIPVNQIIAIDRKFFLHILSIQGSFAFLLTAFVGPGLISPDLANNALPLYLSRPFSRSEYVVGKMSVLAILLSLMTWVPCLLLFLLQSNLEGAGWMADNVRIAVAVFLGSWIWIVTVGLLALALSAWVKWRTVAGALLFGVFFAAAGFGQVINNILETDWGYVIDLGEVLRTIWSWLFFGAEASIFGGQFGGRSGTFLPVWSAFLSVAVTCTICLGLLARKIRAYEVVK